MDYTETRYYVGAIDEIETVRLDGTTVTLGRSEGIDCTADDAAFYDLQPDNWSADPLARGPEFPVVHSERPDGPDLGEPVGDLTYADDATEIPIDQEGDA